MTQCAGPLDAIDPLKPRRKSHARPYIDQRLVHDMKQLKELGHVNFVRGAHYPQDPRWLDRLDENGIVVWSGKKNK